MKTLTHLFVLASMVTLIACGSSKSAKQMRYSASREITDKLKEYTRNGWQVHGTTRTLRGKLIEYYSKKEANPNLYELIGTSTGCRSITVCRAAALNAACMELATKVGQDLKGKTMRDLGGDEGAEVPMEYNKFQSVCIGNFQASIQEDMIEGLALIRKVGEVNDYEIFYLIEKYEIQRKRRRAIEEALKESQLNKEHIRTVEKFIDDDSGIYK